MANTIFSVDTITVNESVIISSSFIDATSSWALYSGHDVTKSFTDSVYWEFNHELGRRDVVIQAYDIDYKQLIPQEIQLINENTASLTFSSPVNGFAIATYGGLTSHVTTPIYNITESYYVTNSYSSSTYNVTESYYTNYSSSYYSYTSSIIQDLSLYQGIFQGSSYSYGSEQTITINSDNLSDPDNIITGGTGVSYISLASKGYYQVYAQLTLNYESQVNDTGYITIVINGTSTYFNNFYLNNDILCTTSISCLVYAEGATTIAVKVFSNNTNYTILQNPSNCSYIHVIKLRGFS